MLKKLEVWSVSLLTLVPELFPGPLGLSIAGRALRKGIWALDVCNIRDYASGKHLKVDDTPYGGGRGMVIRADVLGRAIEAKLLQNGNDIIYLSPRGKVLNQSLARSLIEKPGINVICGRFEGIDERVINEYRVLEVSVGDFVLSSGDIAAYCLLDACVRMLPGVVGNTGSLEKESFGLSSGYEFLLEYPQFTKPRDWKGREIPPVLLSGDHGAIEKWKLSQAVLKTQQVRPDLWDRYIKGDLK